MGCKNLHLENVYIHGTNSLHYQFADSGIVSIRVGADVKSIWDGSFKGCTDLQSITVDAGNSIFFSKDGILYDKVYKTYGGEVIGNNICCYPAGKSWAGSYTLPSDVVLLSGFAFDSCKFTEIHIPARVLDLDRASLASLGDHSNYYAFDSIKDSCKLYVVRNSYVDNYFNDRYQGIPVGGYNVLIERLLDSCDVRLNVDFLQDKENLSSLANKIVYTGTIDSYYDYQYGALEYRSVRFESEILDEQNHQGVAVVNYTDRETPYTRVIEHKHFEFGTQPKTVVTKEYSADWKLGDEPYYPVNDEKNQKVYAQYETLAKNEPNVIFGGRLAEYKYYDMDKVIASALDAAQRELSGK